MRNLFYLLFLGILILPACTPQSGSITLSEDSNSIQNNEVVDSNSDESNEDLIHASNVDMPDLNESGVGQIDVVDLNELVDENYITQENIWFSPEAYSMLPSFILEAIDSASGPDFNSEKPLGYDRYVNEEGLNFTFGLPDSGLVIYLLYQKDELESGSIDDSYYFYLEQELPGGESRFYGPFEGPLKSVF